MYKIIDPMKPQFFLNDLGRGYGALVYVLRSTLDVLDRCSRLGTFCNFLTSYSYERKERDYLYCVVPCRI